jgi:hypothetical protein
MAFAGAQAAPIRAGGASVVQNITMPVAPADPHAFSKALAFEMRGAL